MKLKAREVIWYIIGSACLLPFIFGIYTVINNAVHGMTFLSDEKLYGSEAAILTAALLSSSYWWLILICVSGIIISVIRISSLNKTTKDIPEPKFNGDIQTVEDIVNSEWKDY